MTYQDSYSGRKPFAQAFPNDVTTDSSGRFTFDGLVPEREYVKILERHLCARLHVNFPTQSMAVDAPFVGTKAQDRDVVTDL